MERSATSWLPWIDVVAGIWIIVMPFVFGLSLTVHWASIVLGAIILIIGLLAWYGTGAANLNWSWMSWINVVLGLVTVYYPFFYGLTGGVMTSYVVTGAIVFIVAVVHALVPATGRTMVR
jgi:hypothetical protein